MKTSCKLLGVAVIATAMFACTPGAVVVHQSTYPADNNYPANNYPSTANTYPQNQDEASYQVFYDDLSQYGFWVDYPGYGYVWGPNNVSQDFQPYQTNGHWVYSDEGWTWVSDYQFGWAVFHYGRWFYDDSYGWLWVPGHEWAPAWVTWGQANGYYGWAPLGPNQGAGQQYTPPARAWSFVPQQHIARADVNNYVVNKSENVNIVKNVTVINNTTNVTNNNSTTVVNNNSNNRTVINNNNRTANNTTVNNNNVNMRNTVVYNKGPQVHEVETVANMHVQAVKINNTARPSATAVSNNSLTMYRPMFKQPAQMQNKPAPRNVQGYHPGANPRMNNNNNRPQP